MQLKVSYRSRSDCYRIEVDSMLLKQKNILNQLQAAINLTEQIQYIMRSKTRLAKIIYTTGIILSFLDSYLVYSIRNMGGRPADEPNLMQKLGDFFNFFYPAFIFLILFYVALKWKYTGGIISVVAGIGIFILSFFAETIIPTYLIVPGCLAAIIAGMLFVRNYTEF